MKPTILILNALKFLGIGIALFAGILVFMSFTGTALPLSFLKTTIQDHGRSILDRELVIEGEIGLIPGLTPKFSIQGVSLANTEGWQQREFASVDQLSAELHLLPLLDAKIHVGDVVLNGVKVDLVKPRQGKANWFFGAQPSGKASSSSEPHIKPDNPDKGVQLSAVDSIQINNVFLSYTDEGSSAHYDVELAHGLIQVPEEESATIDFEGTLNSLPLTLQLISDPLQNLYRQQFPIRLNAEAGIGYMELLAEAEFLGGEVLLETKLHGDELNQLNEALGMRLPSIQNYRASASMSYVEDALKISELRASFDDSVVNAELYIEHGKEPLKLSGVVDIKSLNIDSLITHAQQATPTSSVQNSDHIAADNDPKLDDIPGLVKQLSSYTVDLSLDVERLTAGDIVVKDSSLQLALKDGKLDSPISIILNNIPMEGNLSLLGEDGTLSANAFLSTENNRVGDLERWFKLDGIDGSLGKLNLSVQTVGRDLSSLIEQFNASLMIEGADLRYGNSAGTEGVPLSLERLSASIATRSPLDLEVDGALHEEAFTLSFAGGNLEQLAKGEDWPFNISGSGAGAKLLVEGIVREPRENTGTELKISLTGSGLGRLSPWLGVVPDADADYKFAASAKTHSTGLMIPSYEVVIGSSNLKGQMSASKKPDGPLYTADIVSDLINVRELATFFPEADSAPDDRSDTAKQQPPEEVNTGQITGSALRIPILPTGIALPNADIKVSIKELRPDGPSFTDIGFTGSIRDGVLRSSPFSMQLAHAVFSGSIAFDSLTSPPKMSLLVETREIDVGELLDVYKIVQGTDLSAELLRLKIELKGHSLGSILNNSSISAEIRNGKWVLVDQGSGSEFPLELQQGTLSIKPNSPFSLINDVEYKGEKIRIAITLDQLITKKTGEDVSLEINVQYDDNSLSLTGTSPLPVDIESTVMSMDMHGTNTGSLATLTGLPVPEFGPYKLEGRFTMDSQGYYLEKLQTQIGESVLEGVATLKTNLSVPEFEVRLVSEHFQINDFKTPKSSTPKQQATTERAPKTSEDKTETKTENEQIKGSIDAKLLAAANGSFNLKAKEVVSGNDWLGEGEINLNLRDSHLDINPINVKLPGGNIDVSLSMHPAAEDMDVRLHAMVDQFDYGVLARRRDPETKMTGIIDLDVALASRTRSLDVLLANANGRIDFVLLPEHFEAGMIDLWAASLLAFVLPKLGSDVSLINCMIAQFDLEDGLMKEKQLVLDTSKLRAGGKGSINFKDQTISYILKPKPKNPRLFQVQPPLKINGSFANLKFGVDGGLIGTALGMATTTLTVPIRILMNKNVPRDGSDICTPSAARRVKQ